MEKEEKKTSRKKKTNSNSGPVPAVASYAVAESPAHFLECYQKARLFMKCHTNSAKSNEFKNHLLVTLREATVKITSERKTLSFE